MLKFIYFSFILEFLFASFSLKKNGVKSNHIKAKNRDKKKIININLQYMKSVIHIIIFD